MRAHATALFRIGLGAFLLVAPMSQAAVSAESGPAVQLAGRCLRAQRSKPVPGEPKTAFTQQLCLREISVEENGSIRVAVRHAESLDSVARATGAAPVVHLVRPRDGADRPEGAALPARYEELKTPVDVVAVVMLPRHRADAPDHEAGLRGGLLALLSETYRVPGSRFGLLGYSESATDFLPRLPAANEPLIEEKKSEALRDAIKGLTLSANQPSEWYIKPAVLSAYEMFGLGRPTAGTEPRRRHLVLFTNGIDYDPDTARVFASLARNAVMDGVSVTLISPPRYTNPVRSEVAPLVDGTGGLVYAARSSEEVEQAFRRVGTELRGQTVVSFRPEPASSRTAPLRFGLALPEAPLALLPIALERPVRLTMSPAQGKAEPRRRIGWIAFLSASGGFCSLALLGLWLRRRQGARLHASGSPGRPARAPSVPAVARVWLHWVDLGRDILLDELPHTLGNDLDCDTVLLGVGGQRKRCEIRRDAATDSLYLVPLDPDSVRCQQSWVAGPLKLADGAEFLVNTQRFKLFITQLTALDPGGLP